MRTLDTQPRLEQQMQLSMNVEGVSLAFGGQGVLRDVSFVLRRGQMVLIRGDNGSGKTTLLNVLSGHLRPDSGKVIYLLGGQAIDLGQHSPEELAELGVGRTWQDIRLFSTLTVIENILAADSFERDLDGGSGQFDAVAKVGTRRKPAWWLAPVAGTGLVGAAVTGLIAPFGAVLPGALAGRIQSGRAQLLARAKGNLELVGMQSWANSSCDKLSVGQMKRVALARALQKEPQILLLDEPLAGLDKESAEAVVAALRKFTQDRGRTVVIIEHQVTLLHNTADSTYQLRGGILEEV